MSLLKISNKTIYRLSPTQIYALHLGAEYRLRRSSHGWECAGHPRWGVTEPTQFISPVTVKSLWRMGLLGGTPDAKIVGEPIPEDSVPELWTNDRGQELLQHVHSRMGIFLDLDKDVLVYHTYRDAGFVTVVLDPPVDPSRPSLRRYFRESAKSASAPDK